MSNLKYWLLWGALALLVAQMLSSCAAPRHTAEAPPKARRYYQHRQRLHKRERARRPKPSLLWNRS